MTTFKGEIILSERRKDGTWNVKIRVTHKRKVRRCSTQMYVNTKDVTKSGNIKNQVVIDGIDEIIRDWRKKLNSIGKRADTMEVDDLIRIFTQPAEGEGIPMWPWMEKYLDKIPKRATRESYFYAIRHFKKFIGADIFFQDLKYSTIKKYIETSKNNCVYKYAMNIRKMYREAMDEFNDLENEVMRIPHDPFIQVKIKLPVSSADRSVPVETIRMIARIPDEKRPRSNRNVTRDMFLLSLMTMGMNMVDLMEVGKPIDDYIIYNRSKTKDKRTDKAEMRVLLHPLAKKIIKKHEGREKLLNLSERYCCVRNANQEMMYGIKKIKACLIEQYHRDHEGVTDDVIIKRLRLENLTFYSARHSWATIARNDLDIDKWTVHEGLNHVDNATKITDVYIKRDFRRVNEANYKVIEYIFGEELLKN